MIFRDDGDRHTESDLYRVARKLAPYCNKQRPTYTFRVKKAMAVQAVRKVWSKSVLDRIIG